MIKNTTANKSSETWTNKDGRKRGGGDRHCICAMTMMMIIIDRTSSPWTEEKEKRKEKEKNIEDIHIDTYELRRRIIDKRTDFHNHSRRKIRVIKELFYS